MRRFIFSLALVCSYAFKSAHSFGGAMEGLEDAMDIQREQLERLGDCLGPMNIPSSAPAKRQSSITFSNPAAEQFFVDGTKIPLGIC
jgi:carboxypeptidase D